MSVNSSGNVDKANERVAHVDSASERSESERSKQSEQSKQSESIYTINEWACVEIHVIVDQDGGQANIELDQGPGKGTRELPS